MDRYRSFAELAGEEPEGESWAREYRSRESSFLIMAPHGGWIEPFTSELAEAIAGDDLSFYTFRGIKDGGGQPLHLTSHRFDEPLALEAASSSQVVVAVHGEKTREEAFIMVGGGHSKLKEALKAALSRRGFAVRKPRVGLGGQNPRNICNRGKAGAGVQLEVSEGLRRQLKVHSELQGRFVRAVREALLAHPTE